MLQMGFESTPPPPAIGIRKRHRKVASCFIYLLGDPESFFFFLVYFIFVKKSYLSTSFRISDRLKSVMDNVISWKSSRL